MRFILLRLPILLFFFGIFISAVDFKASQLHYSRVKTAFAEKEKSLTDSLKVKNINSSEVEIFIRVFKNEKELEIWAKNKSDKKFQLFRTYKICATSGNLGPKREGGDGQTPEGFYYINRFNPYSNFYLSLGVNYPNASDRKLSKAKNLGGDIFIHGACVTIGCMPLTDDKIKEVYALAVLARNNGESKIPVHIFPLKMSNENFASLKKQYAQLPDLITFWGNIKTGYDYFDNNKSIPSITVLSNGYYSF